LKTTLHVPRGLFAAPTILSIAFLVAGFLCCPVFLNAANAGDSGLLGYSLKQQEFVPLQIPENTVAVSVFEESRTLEEEYSFLSMVYFRAGEHELPLGSGTYPLDIIERFEFGPERDPLVPEGPGEIIARSSGNPVNRVEWTFEQDFEFRDTTLTITIDYLWTNIADGRPDKDTIVFDEPFLSQQMYMLGVTRVGVRVDIIRFASLSYASLPLYRVDFTLEGGQSLRLYQRWQPPMAGSGPANLVYAEVDIDEGRVTEDNYWNLVYSADHHNWDERYWVLFDPPLGEAYGVAAFAGGFEQKPQVYTLDADLQPLRQIPLLNFEKRPVETLPVPEPTPPPVCVEQWELYFTH